MNLHPIWPWAEENQGLLTLVALVIALFFAVIENRRANRVDDTRRKQFIDAIVGLANEIELVTKLLIAKVHPSATSLPDDVAQAWSQNVSDLFLAIWDLLRASPSDAKTILAARNVWIAARTPTLAALVNNPPNHSPLIVNWLENVTAARKKLASLK